MFEFFTFTGSENEVKEESLLTNRPLISQSIVRLRRDFGAPITFKDRNVGDAKDAYIECAAYEDPSYDVVKVEQDCAIQVGAWQSLCSTNGSGLTNTKLM